MKIFIGTRFLHLHGKGTPRMGDSDAASATCPTQADSRECTATMRRTLTNKESMSRAGGSARRTGEPERRGSQPDDARFKTEGACRPPSIDERVRQNGSEADLAAGIEYLTLHLDVDDRAGGHHPGGGADDHGHRTCPDRLRGPGTLDGSP